MTSPWTTPAVPGARTRHFCPLCDWHLDTPDPNPAPAVSREWVEQVRAERGEKADDPVFLGMLAHLQPIDEQIRAHLETHTLVEWVTKVSRLQQQVSELQEQLKPPFAIIDFPADLTAQQIAQFQAAYDTSGRKVEYRQAGKTIGPDDVVRVYCPVCGSLTMSMHRAVVPVGVPRCGECVRAGRHA